MSRKRSELEGMLRQMMRSAAGLGYDARAYPWMTRTEAVRDIADSDLTDQLMENVLPLIRAAALKEES